MTRAVIADASQVSAADFARSLGLRIRSAEQKQADWNAKVDWYVERILAGCEFSEFGNPQVAEAKKRIAEAEQTILGHTAASLSDPLLKRRAA
jgi:hypothetical protein